eukprot:CFRG0564T1
MAGRGRGRGGVAAFAPDGIPAMPTEATMARPPATYPERSLFESEIEWTEELQEKVQDARRIDYLSQRNVFYLQEQCPAPKIARYSDRYSKREVSSGVSDRIADNMWSYFPDELRPPSKRTRRERARGSGANSAMLFNGDTEDAIEGVGNLTGVATGDGVGSDDEDKQKSDEEDVEDLAGEEEGDDYGEDYYQSADEADSGGDDEVIY